MKRLVVAVALVALSVPLVPSASAKGRPCVTKRDFQAVKDASRESQLYRSDVRAMLAPTPTENSLFDQYEGCGHRGSHGYKDHESYIQVRFYYGGDDQLTSCQRREVLRRR